LYQLETLPQLAPPERIETGFSEPVSVRMHPTEPMLVVWGVSQQDVVLLHLETGQQQRLPINARRPVDIAVSPDGRLVAAGSADFNAYVWHSGHQTVLHQLTGHQSQVVGVFFSSDSHLVATRSWDQTTRLWNPDSGRFLLAIDGETQFGQDAGQLAIRNQNQVTICDLADGREFQVMRGHEGGKGPWTLDVSPDGNLLASAGADGVRIWDTVTAQQVAHLSVGPGQIALFHPDGSGIFTGGSRKLEFWPLETLTNGSGRGDISLGIGKSRHVARTVVVPDRFCADITGDGTLVWFADYDRVRTSSPPFVAHTDVTCRSDSSFLAISPDGGLAATSHESDSPFVSVRDTASGEELHRFPHQRGHIRPRFSPDSRHLVTNVPSEYYVWDVATGECLTTIPRSSGLHGAIAWTADGRTLALECGGVHLLNGETFEPLAVLGPPVSHGIATALEITPDGRRLFAAYESREIHCWDLQRIRDQLGDLGLDWE
jgi:WD40 repeat protein